MWRAKGRRRALTRLVLCSHLTYPCALQGYDNPQCRQPICDAFSCLNGGTCVAPNQCECVGGRYGDNCRACSGSHWEIFGMCIHIWIAGTSLAGLTMVVLLAAFARQAKGAYRARKQFKFLSLKSKIQSLISLRAKATA